MTKPASAPILALQQTPAQVQAGTVTYRVFIDRAWHNVEGPAAWRQEEKAELILKLAEQYLRYTSKEK